ncbi:hypothetical protein SteCoe_6215 [Stentor coeruleus]|uniref:Uncharacterized protein n=1 Tax=Stentor coeruleus TaxID=5963 RepID=A0A1R2CQF5_9CILI|nr:hypothetical protein SteCoe_6215 [Stentor coeruleus]
MPRFTIFESVKRIPPILCDNYSFSIFKSIIDKTVISQAIDIFIADTLAKENCPFNNENEGRAMIRNAFTWVMESGNTYFTNMMELGHGYSIDGYVFIDYSYIKGNDFCMAFIILTLLYECFHIYKRIGENKNRYIKSPINSFVLFLEDIEKPEDGSRFENILIPGKGINLYLSSANFLNDIDSWNMNLEMFNEKFNLLQVYGRESGEPFLKFYTKSQGMNWPKCLRL